MKRAFKFTVPPTSDDLKLLQGRYEDNYGTALVLVNLKSLLEFYVYEQYVALNTCIITFLMVGECSKNPA